MVQNLGENMKHLEKRYRVLYNEKTDTWRILDTWNDAMNKITDWEVDIPDTNPALLILPGQAFTELAMEAARRGILGKAVIPRVSDTDIEERENQIALLKAELEGIGSVLKDMQSENITLRKEISDSKKAPVRTERYELKHQVLKGLLQLAGMEDLRDIDKS
jgi:Tfp pilus assembly protein PilN